MKVKIKTIPHQGQRYPTCGDWYWEGDTLIIKVSKMSDWRYEALVAFHEFAEAMMCKEQNISEHDITNYDIDFEFQRANGVVDGEPGDSEHAPYRGQHFVATNLERILAHELGVDWSKYDKEVSNL